MAAEGMSDDQIPAINWPEVNRAMIFILNDFLQWHLHGEGGNEGAD